MVETIIKIFNSPVTFLKWATDAPALWTGSLESRAQGNKAWAGTENYEEAYELALYGWLDGLKMLSRQVHVAATRPAAVAVQRHKRYDIAGIYPEPARAAAGEIFSMVAAGDDSARKPIIKIRTNASYNACISAEKIMKWGAAIVSYVDALERAGFSVQLDSVTESACGGGPSVSFQFPLKKAGDPLSLINMVFWWAHPAALRRIDFSAKERLDIERWYRRTYGTATTVTKAAPGTLDLSIEDAANDIESNLEIIRRKHAGILAQNNRFFALRPEI